MSSSNTVAPPTEEVKAALDVSLIAFNLNRRLRALVDADLVHGNGGRPPETPHPGPVPVEAPGVAVVTLLWTRLEGRESVHELISTREDLLPTIGVNRSRLYELLKTHRTDSVGLLRDLGVDLGVCPKGFSLYVIDDTVRPITGAKMDGASYHRIPHEKRSALAHCVVALYRKGTQKGGFVDYELKFNKRRPQKAKRPGQPPAQIRRARTSSKTQLAADMLGRLPTTTELERPIAAFDGGYTARWFLRRVKELGFDWVAPLDVTDRIEVPDLGGELKAGELHAHLPSYRRVAGTDHQARQKWGVLRGYGEVRFVAVWWLREGEETYRKRVLATTAEDLSQSGVVLVYTMRWDIEVGFKNLKGPAGLKAYHRRRFVDIRAEIAASGLAHAVLTAVAAELGGRWGLKQVARVVREVLRAMPAEEVVRLLLGGIEQAESMIPTRFRPTGGGLHEL